MEPLSKSPVTYTTGRRVGKTAQVLFETAVLVKNEDVEVYIQVDTETMRDRVRHYFTDSLPEEKQDRIHFITEKDDVVELPPETCHDSKRYVINLSTNRPVIYYPIARITQ